MKYRCYAALLALMAGPAIAGSGQITFRGAITQGSCDMNVVQNRIIASCYNPVSGQTGVTTADLSEQQSLDKLPVEVKIRWINPEKNRGVIEVTYL